MLKHEHLSNHNTWETFKTHMEEGFSLLKIINRDYLRFVNPLTITSLTVSNFFHVSWFDEYLWLSTLYMIYLTCFIYMYHLAFGGFSLDRWRRTRAKEDKDRINRRVWGESFLSSYFLYCTLESIACKFHEYVGNPRPSVIRCLFLYNNYHIFQLYTIWNIQPSFIN